MQVLVKRIEIYQGDITKLKVDAIVNAANNLLLGGGGVDGAIHRAAGPELLKECKNLNGCQTGDAKLTKGYNLPAKFVIHTVGPIWKGGNHQEKTLLRQSYRSCFKLIDKYQITTIAFPAISTGVYAFPIKKATKIAFEETLSYLEKNTSLQKVIFTCFNDEVYTTYLYFYKQFCRN